MTTGRLASTVYARGDASNLNPSAFWVGHKPKEKLQATWLGHAVSALLVHHITMKPLPDETATSRLKQFGMMMLVFDLYDQGEPITLTALTDLSGLTRGGVTESVDPLVRRGLLAETMGTNALRRGRARRFSIAPAVFANLRSALGHFEIPTEPR